MTPKTCSKESGAKLAELGVRVPSYFSYVTEIAIRPSSDFAKHLKTPAYLSGELGEMLPEQFECRKASFGYEVECSYTVFSESGWNIKEFRSPVEAEARALMLVWLIENGHVTVEEINT